MKTKSFKYELKKKKIKILEELGKVIKNLKTKK